jgi:lipoprotein NlpD
MFVCWRRAMVGSLVAGSVLLLAACSSPSLSRAPVEDRNTSRAAGGMDTRVKQPPGFENAGKPGYYTVKPGETLIRIGLETGQNWKDIARWNNLDRPNEIEVGQVLRVLPPGIGTAAASTPASAEAGASAPPVGVITRPVMSAGAVVSSVPPPAQSAKPAAAASASEGAASGDDQLAWGWPVKGPVLAGFDEVKNKGLDIGGSAGEPVLAAADGRVVYAGAGLRGYGNLIILKHNSTYLTAYAHNQSLLVKEDQSVRKGQKIAEMGNSDADRVKLHFEVRRQGKPVDPAKFLPAR